ARDTTSEVAATAESAASTEFAVSSSVTLLSGVTGGPRAALVAERGATPIWSPAGGAGATTSVATPTTSAARTEFAVFTSVTLTIAATGESGHSGGHS